MNKVQYVNVVFSNYEGEWHDETYEYKAPEGLVAANDLIVVGVYRGLDYPKYVVVKVISVHDMPEVNCNHKWIVSKVDTSQYDDIVRKEEEKNRLMAQLEEQYAAAEKRAVYEMLAEKDKAFAETLNKLKALEE